MTPYIEFKSNTFLVAMAVLMPTMSACSILTKWLYGGYVWTWMWLVAVLVGAYVGAVAREVDDRARRRHFRSWLHLAMIEVIALQEADHRE